MIVWRRLLVSFHIYGLAVELVHVLMWYTCFVVFFFQAEDGIRDLVRSRGLGDVYKRQSKRFVWSMIVVVVHPGFGPLTYLLQCSEDVCAESVSYTHLTLPTSDLV